MIKPSDAVDLFPSAARRVGCRPGRRTGDRSPPGRPAVTAQTGGHQGGCLLDGPGTVGRRMADRWLTYAEAGELFGLSAEAMRKRAHRLRWRTQPGNEGRTLILVPDGAALHPTAHPAGHRPDVRADELLAEVLAETRRRAGAGQAPRP